MKNGVTQIATGKDVLKQVVCDIELKRHSTEQFRGTGCGPAPVNPKLFHLTTR